MNFRVQFPLALAAAGAVAFGSALGAQATSGKKPIPRKAPTAQTSATDNTPIPLDPAVRAGRLPNGLRYFIRHNERPEKRVELRLVVNAGSVLEDDDQRGLAHFVEHMEFNGTKHFQKNDLVKYLQSIGVRFGADLNAYTGFDETVYMLPVPTDKPGLVEKGIQILEDWAHEATFDSMQVVDERGVILEEWRLGLGADSRIRDKEFPVLFKGSRYAVRLPIGLPDIIRHANPAPIKRFYHDWYRPDLMAVIAVGDINPDSIEALVKAHFAHLRNPVPERPRPTTAVPGNVAPLVTVATDPEQQVSSVQVLYKHHPRPIRTMAAYRTLLIGRLYNSMLNERLTEISRQPNAPFTFASSGYGPLVRSSDVYSLEAVVPDGGVTKGLDALLVEARRVDTRGFLESELARTKTSILRSLESAWTEREKTESGAYVDEYVSYFLEGEPTPGIAWEFETAKQELPAITVAQVDSLGSGWITDDNRVVAVAAPEKPGVSVPSPAELLAAFSRADTTTVAAYTENVSSAPLVPRVPPRGSIVSESHLADLGVTDWRLSNGVRVLVKPTDFKADEVLMRAWSPGGLSLIPDSEYVSGVLATTIAQRGGVDDLTAIELQKKLAGKRVGLAPVLEDLSQGFQGSASPRDLETLMQLVYLRMTEPRKDTAAFQALRSQFNVVLANRATDPDQVFSDTIEVTMAQHHPRSRPLDSALVASVNLDEALDIYRNRLSDASGLTFAFVGAVNVESLRPLAEQWLAALPASGRKESWRDVGERPPGGVIEKVVHKGTEPKADTYVFFTGDASYTPATRYALRALSDLLEMHMLDVMREALGSTYSVSVSGAVEKYPVEQYTMSVHFGSAPDKVDTLYHTMLAIIDSVKQHGVSDADVQKVREQEQREQEVALKENSWWLGNMTARIEYGEDPRGLLTYSADFIQKLTGDEIKDAATRFLSEQRMARFVLLPQKTVP